MDHSGLLEVHLKISCSFINCNNNKNDTVAHTHICIVWTCQTCNHDLLFLPIQALIKPVWSSLARLGFQLSRHKHLSKHIDDFKRKFQCTVLSPTNTDKKKKIEFYQCSLMLKSVNPQSVLISSPVAGHILDAKKQSNKQIEIKKKT